MTNSSIRQSRVLTLLLTAVAIAGVPAYAIHCVENVKSLRSPSKNVILKEVSQAEIEHSQVEIVETPVTQMSKIDELETTYVRDASKSDTNLVGLTGPQQYVRPNTEDFKEIKGFMERQSIEVPRGARKEIYAPIQKQLVYFTPNKPILYVQLTDGTTLEAVTRLNSTHMVAATVLPERSLQIGFTTKPTRRTYHVELYSFEPTGYTVTEFTVRATQKEPMVRFYQTKDKGPKKKTYLAVDDRLFLLEVAPRKKEAYLVIDGEAIPVNLDQVPANKP